MGPDLSQRAVLVLTSLAGGPKHGYALINDIEQFAGVKLGPGTLYGVLARLEDSGLIKALPSEGRRYPYEITETGTTELTERLVSDGQIAKVGLERIGLQPA
jgi:DNA-binding PadR family transcriptional regulator